MPPEPIPGGCLKPDHALNQGLLREFLDLQLDLTLHLIETARITRNQGRCWTVLRDARAAFAVARQLAERTASDSLPSAFRLRMPELAAALQALSSGPVMLPVNGEPESPVSLSRTRIV